MTWVFSRAMHHFVGQLRLGRGNVAESIHGLQEALGILLVDAHRGIPLGDFIEEYMRLSRAEAWLRTRARAFRPSCYRYHQVRCLFSAV